MAQLMDKANFCACADTLRKYTKWENTMYDNGFDFALTPAGDLAEKLHAAMCGFDLDWSYDKKLGFDWVIEWCFNKEPYRVQFRHGREWHLDDAGILYDFLVFMNDLGWED